MNTITYNEMLYRAAEAAGRTRDKIPVSEAALLKSVFAQELRQVWGSCDWNQLIPEPLAVTVADRKFANPYTDTSKIVVSGAGLAAANGTYEFDGTDYVNGDYRITNILGVRWNLTSDATSDLYFINTGTAAPIGSWYDYEAYTPAPTSAYFTATFGDIIGVYSANPRTSTKARPLDWHESDGYIHIAPDGIFPDAGTAYVEYLLPPTDLLAVSAEDLGETEIPQFLANYLAERGAAQLLVADGMSAMAGVHFGLAKEALAFETDNITRPWWRRQIRYRNS